MNTLPRIAVLFPFTAGVVAGASLPARASFSDPAKVSTTTTTKNTDLSVSACWTASGSRGVSGYLVNAHLSVTTVTTYGWTAQSAPTGYISC